MSEFSGFNQILFLGNSHTYNHNVPELLLGLVSAANCWKKLEVDSNTGRGVSLAWHWQNSRSRNLIAERSWDYVVLQERSAGPIEDPNGMFRSARMLHGEIRKKKAKGAFYMTWANRHHRETQKTITEAYKKIACELGAVLVPVGCAWENVLAVDSNLSIYEADGRHASLIGAYLAACVFYTAFYGVTPEGLPGNLSEQGITLSNLPMAQALFLQKIAYQAVVDL